MSELELNVLAPDYIRSVWLFVKRNCQNRRLLVGQALPIEPKIEGSVAEKHSIYVCQVFLDLPQCSPYRHVVQFVESDLSKVILFSRRPLVDFEFFQFIPYNHCNVESDGSLNRLAQSFRSNLPLGSEPASSALHAHPEL